jgi:hypothetical protein
MRVGLIDSALLVVLSMTGVAGLVTVGVLMAVTSIVAPAVTARMLGRSLNAMFAIAVASGLMAGVAGLLVSYRAGLPTGPADCGAGRRSGTVGVPRPSVTAKPDSRQGLCGRSLPAVRTRPVRIGRWSGGR